MSIQWLEDVRSTDIETVGGKAASLEELTAAGLPVPPGFVVTAATFRTFLESTEIDAELFRALEDDGDRLADAALRARKLITETPLPESVRDEIITAYRSLGGDGDT